MGKQGLSRLLSRRFLDNVGFALFFFIVIVPVSTLGYYLVFLAADQFHSRSAFSVRSEQGGGMAQNFLGILNTVGGSGSASDLDLLNGYIQSEAIIERVSEEVDLRQIFSQQEKDWYYSLDDNASIEALLKHWQKMVFVSNEAHDGILQLEVRAFNPESARDVMEAILKASSDLINRLSNDARSDALRLSQQLVDEARADVHLVLQKLTAFRREYNIVSPEIDLETSGGVLNALQTQLAEALVAKEQLMSIANVSDPRRIKLDSQIDALRTQIEVEKTNRSRSDSTASVDIYGRYQSLLLEQEMMTSAYSQALASLASAHTETRRQARYLAVHIPPTLAETSQYPKRIKIIFITLIILSLAWTIVYIFYRNARDRF